MVNRDENVVNAATLRFSEKRRPRRKDRTRRIEDVRKESSKEREESLAKIETRWTQREMGQTEGKKVTTCGLTCSMVGRWAVTDTPGAATRPSRTDSAISCDSAQARSPARPPRSESFSGACPDPREHHPCWPTEPTNQCALTCIFATFTYAIVQGECLSLLASCWIEFSTGARRTCQR